MKLIGRRIPGILLMQIDEYLTIEALNILQNIIMNNLKYIILDALITSDLL